MAKRINYASMFTLRKDGRYMATYTDKTGRHCLYDRDPERLYQRIQDAREPKEAPPPTFEEIAEAWAEEHQAEITQRTWNNYEPHYAQIIQRHGNKPIEDVTAMDVNKHLMEAKAQGYSATVVNSIRSIYRMIYDYAIIHEAAKYNPVASVRLPKGLKRGKRVAPTDEQIRTIFNHVDHPFGLFPFVLLCTGLRKSEALALTWSDVNLEKREISITKSLEYVNGSTPSIKSPKTDAGTRVVPIVDMLLVRLSEARRTAHSEILFPSQDSNRSGKGGGYMTLRGYEGAWERYCAAAGLMDGNKPTITAHNLRHGTATLMFEMGVDELTAQKILGHSRVEITREIYTQLREEQSRKSVEKFNSGLSRYAK